MKPSFPTFSIKQTVIFLICAMGLLASSLTIQQIASSNREYDVAKQVVDLAQVNQSVFSAVSAFRVERSIMQSALILPKDTNQSAIDAYTTRGKVVDEALLQAKTRAATVDLPELASAIASADESHRHVRDLRGSVAAQATLPLDARDRQATAKIISVGSDFVAKLDKVTRIIDGEVRALNPALGDMVAVIALGWSARNNFALAGYMVESIAAQDRAFDIKELNTITAYDAGGRVSWRLLHNVTDNSRTDPAVKAAIDTARAQYFAGPFKEMRETVMASIMGGMKPNVSVDQWRETSVPPIDAMAAIASVAIERVIAQAKAAADGAWMKLRNYIGLLLVNVLIVAFCYVVVRGRITGPIAGLTASMTRLAGGELDVELRHSGRDDEIGAMASALTVFRDNQLKVRDLSSEQNAEREKKTERAQRLEVIVQNFEQRMGDLVSSLSSASTGLGQTARTMTGAAVHTSAQASAVAAAAEEASSGADTVAAAAAQLSSSIQEISQQVSQSSRLANGAVGATQRTDTIVRQLSISAERIGHVVSLITDIAGRTNLLALNATIEAARAGEGGKGFAVVASEVKALANQTTRATDDIGTQIAEIQSATRDAVKAIGDIGGQIDGVGSIVASIAVAVEEQRSATAEITRSVQQTAMSAQDVTANIAGVSLAANSTGVEAEHVLHAAGELSVHAENLKREISDFVAMVQAA